MLALTIYRWIARQAQTSPSVSEVPARWRSRPLRAPHPATVSRRQRAVALTRLDARNNVYGKALEWRTILDTHPDDGATYISETSYGDWKMVSVLTIEGDLALVRQQAYRADGPEPTFVVRARSAATPTSTVGGRVESERDGDLVHGTATLLAISLETPADRECREALVESARLDVFNLRQVA